MSHASFPYSFWFYAVQTAIFLINLHPKTVLQSHSPWPNLYHSKPTLSQRKVFGCACHPYLRPYTSHKLEPRTKECTFIGYSVQSKGYFCHDRSTQTIYTSRHVLLNESLFPFASPNTSHTSPSVSPASSSSIDLLWLSNLPYLHSTNAHSLLGPVPISTSPHSTPISSLDPLPNSVALPSTVPDSVPLQKSYQLLSLNLHFLLSMCILCKPGPTMVLAQWDQISNTKSRKKNLG